MLILSASGLFAQQSFVDKPVAIVRLTRTDVISQRKLAQSVEFYEAQSGRTLTVDEKQEVLQTLINQMLVLQAAQRDNVSVTDQQVLQMGMGQMMQQMGRQITEAQYRQIIEEQSGVDYDTYTQSIRDQILLEKYVSEKKKDFIRTSSIPTDDEIETFYSQNEDKFINPEMVRLSHIFFNTRGMDASAKAEVKSKAESVYQQIVKGDATFPEMVREHSDDKETVVRDGDLGTYIDRSEQNVAVFGRDFLNTVFRMNTGQVSEVLESTQGYHIVKLDDRQGKRFLEIDDPVSPVETTTVRQYISNVISYQKQQVAFQQAAAQVVQDLVKDADIQLFIENIE